ncbi:MAG: hypothetical protein AAGG48_30310 [Planctomycetota bacterium]
MARPHEIQNGAAREAMERTFEALHAGPVVDPKKLFLTDPTSFERLVEKVESGDERKPTNFAARVRTVGTQSERYLAAPSRYLLQIPFGLRESRTCE